jgi:hypothetical protein
MPHSTYSKKKSFHFLEGTMNLFEELKWSKTGETTQYFEKCFFINRSYIFIALPKFYATHRNYEILSRSLVPAPIGQAETG